MNTDKKKYQEYLHKMRKIEDVFKQNEVCRKSHRNVKQEVDNEPVIRHFEEQKNRKRLSSDQQTDWHCVLWLIGIDRQSPSDRRHQTVFISLLVSGGVPNVAWGVQRGCTCTAYLHLIRSIRKDYSISIPVRLPFWTIMPPLLILSIVENRFLMPL